MNRNARIQSLVRRLHWNNAASDILEASTELATLRGEEIRFLIFSNLDKGTWENGNKVLKAIGFPELTPFIPDLLTWFQDSNWPGVEVMTEIFVGSDKKLTLPRIVEAILSASDQNDDAWVGLLHRVRIQRLKPPSGSRTSSHKDGSSSS